MFKFLALVSLYMVLADSQTVKTSTQPMSQNDFGLGLKKLHDKTRTQIPRFTQRNRTKYESNMRQTSSEAYFINEIATFALTSIRVVTSGRQTSSLSVDIKYCPFVKVNCDSTSKYRSANGSCNNLFNPSYGSSNTPYKRLLAPVYDDGINSARTKAVSGKTLPHPRTISLKISPPPLIPKLEFNVSQIYAIFGQFLIHDLSGTSATSDSNGTEIDCPCGSTNTGCLSLTWPANDPALNQSCMKFTRSSASFPDLKCSITYREQLNLLSSYIDGSAIYGIDEIRSKELRSFKWGLLKTSDPVTSTNQRIVNGTYLPLSNDTCSSTSTINYKCFYAGEFRTSENLGLVSMHTLFNREHNRIAQGLAKNNPTWSDEKLYQETRRIIVAILQHIVYNEWLTMVVGNSSLAPNLASTAYYTGYNSNINPALFNEFSTAAFRFGHSLIADKISRYDSANTKMKPINFTETVFKSDFAYDVKAQGIQSVVKGIINDNCWKFGSFGFELQNKLFGKTENNVFTATDLLATNILRGRDHGIQPYIKYVKHCHGIDVKTFDDLRTLFNPTNLANLRAAYENVADIDLYAGGLLEQKISNTTLTAKTFGCIIMQQFADLKNGDRFYYENGPTVNPGAFSLAQLAEIKKVTMSGLICNNYEITSIAKNVFLNPSTSNPSVGCSTVNKIDLSKWTGA